MIDYNSIEALRRIDELIRIGTICETDAEGRSLVKIDLGGELVSDWVPLLQISTPICAVWVAPQVSEQVALLSPSGEPGRGIAIRGIYWKNRKEPKNKANKNAVVEFSDGTELIYDPVGSELKINAENAKLTINCKEATVSATDGVITVSATDGVIVDSKAIKLGKDAKQADGVVTTACQCIFGTPHLEGSKVVFAQKIGAA